MSEQTSALTKITPTREPSSGLALPALLIKLGGLPPLGLFVLVVV
jgi:hypothetical protein